MNRWIVGFVAVVCLSGGTPADAQTFTGAFSGVVHDDTGAVLPGATVTITNVKTGLQRLLITDAGGRYTAPLLPPGDYRIEVELAGFKRTIRESVTVQVDQERRVDFALSVGEVTEQVSVTAEPPLVQTDTATVGTVVTQRQILELPLNGRNFLQLNLLVPGTISGAKGSQLATQGGAINVHGLREASNFFWMDGIDNTTVAIGQLVVNPPTYAVQEFRVMSPTYSAEFGRTAGAQINVITRSGTNAFHGDAYEFLRDDALDAKNFFDPPDVKPPFRRHQFGLDVGGPILRDRTFFFAGYEGIREQRVATFTARVPPPEMLGGDFSNLLPQTVIRDPRTGQPFPGNIIPSRGLDPIGAALAQAYPPPNSADPLRNYLSLPLNRHNDDSMIARLDHQLTKNNRFLIRYNLQNLNVLEPVNLFVRTTNIPGFGRRQPATRFQTFGVGDTHTFTPALLGEFRAGWNRWKLDYLQQDAGDDVAGRLGITGLSRKEIDLGFPLLNMGGAFDNLGSAGNLPQKGPFDTYHAAATLTWVRGLQTWKFGGDYRYFVSDFFLDAAARGSFTFTGGYTGHALSDLLLGLPTVAARGVGTADFLFVQKSTSAFAQNDWQAQPNLTITTGLRYEYNAPVYEKQDRFRNFDFSSGQVLVPLQDGVSRSTYAPDRNNLAPRVGFAWDVRGDGRWSLRGGYGLFYEIAIVNTQLGLRLNPPLFRVDVAFGDGRNVTMANAFGNLATLIPNLNTFQTDFREGYVQQWSMNLQRQLFGNFVVDVGYVGNRGDKLFRQINRNQPLPGPGAVQARRPIPQFGAMNQIASVAKSEYHGFEVRAEKRMSRGMSFLASYTLSRARDDSSAFGGNFSDSNFPQNSRDLAAEWGPSNADAPHRFVLSYLYELPFGVGRRFVSSGVAARILEGWQVNGIYTAQSGQPFTPILAVDNSNTGQFFDRPDIVGDPYAPGADCPQTRTVNCWVNPAAFARPAPFTFGNAGRGSLRGPGYHNLDFSLVKNTPIAGNRMVQLRLEMFNVFNRPNFDNPTRTALTPLFGKIFSAGASRQVQIGLRYVF